VVSQNTGVILNINISVDNTYFLNTYILRITPVFYFVIPASVSQIVIVIMYHPMPTPESFIKFLFFF
jgi:hypothetical protein